MTRKIRSAGLVALGATVALLATACGGGTDDGAASGDGGDQTIVWWHNGTGEPLLSFWQKVADDFEASHDGVTVNVQAFQNEELRNTVIPNALAAGTQVDLFQQWGGGELTSMVDNNQVKDVSGELTDATKTSLGNFADTMAVGDGVYGLPYVATPSGFWVNKDLWTKAGLDTNNFPKTLDELFDAWGKLKDAGITPVAVGGADGWPAAHWWYWAAVRECSADTMTKAVADKDFSDPCFVKAGELLKTILDQDAFNSGWQATSAQQGATSASGLVVTGAAASQLMGAWDAGVMGGIYNQAQGLADDTPPPDFLGWFPFPSIEGGEGSPTAIMSGVDGFSVGVNAPPATVELLEYIVSPDVQKEYAAMGNIPVASEAVTSVEFAPLKDAAQALQDASSVTLWLDTTFGPEISAAMNPAIAAFMGGQGTPADVVSAIQGAADALK